MLKLTNNHYFDSGNHQYWSTRQGLRKQHGPLIIKLLEKPVSTLGRVTRGRMGVPINITRRPAVSTLGSSALLDLAARRGFSRSLACWSKIQNDYTWRDQFAVNSLATLVPCVKHRHDKTSNNTHDRSDLHNLRDDGISATPDHIFRHARLHPYVASK